MDLKELLLGLSRICRGDKSSRHACTFSFLQSILPLPDFSPRQPLHTLVFYLWRLPLVIFEMYAEGDMARLSIDRLAILLHDRDQLRSLHMPNTRRTSQRGSSTTSDSASLMTPLAAQKIIRRWALNKTANCLSASEFSAWARETPDLDIFITAFELVSSSRSVGFSCLCHFSVIKVIFFFY